MHADPPPPLRGEWEPEAMAERKPPKKATRGSAKSTTVNGKAEGFTDEERVAMRERVQEL